MKVPLIQGLKAALNHTKIEKGRLVLSPSAPPDLYVTIMVGIIHFGDALRRHHQPQEKLVEVG